MDWRNLPRISRGGCAYLNYVGSDRRLQRYFRADYIGYTAILSASDGGNNEAASALGWQATFINVDYTEMDAYMVVRIHGRDASPADLRGDEIRPLVSLRAGAERFDALEVVDKSVSRRFLASRAFSRQDSEMSADFLPQPAQAGATVKTVDSQIRKKVMRRLPLFTTGIDQMISILPENGASHF